MTQYSKQVLSDPILLRKKLEIYLGSPDSVETYAKAAEKFFDGEKLVAKSTWSWGAFFLVFLFFTYRKCYAKALVSFIFCLIPFINILIDILFACSAKYEVVSRFVKILDEENDEILRTAGGVNLIGAILFLIFMFILFGSMA